MTEPLSVRIERVKEAVSQLEDNDIEVASWAFTEVRKVSADLIPDLIDAIEEAREVMTYVVSRKKSQGFAVTSEAQAWLDKHGYGDA